MAVIENKGVKIFLIIFAVVAIIIISAVAVNAMTPKVYQQPPQPQPSGIEGLLANIFGQLFQSKNGGGSWWSNLFGGKSDYEKNNCDKDKKGYNKNGILDPSCGGVGSGVCDPFECDPKKPEYNMCGDKGFPCRCGDPLAVC